jgi:acetoin utilization protein AcuB
MTRDVIVVPPRLQLADAWRILQRENIRHLPVAESGRLAGILSDRDLLRAGTPTESGELAFGKQMVAEIMTTRPQVCAPSTSVAEAARLMADRKIDALPVVHGDRLVGLVTSTDLLLLLIDRAPELALPFDFRVTETVLAA